MHPVEIALQWGAVAAALAGAYVAFKRSPFERTKITAEAGAIAVGAQAKIIDDLQSEITRAQEYAQRLKEEWSEERVSLRSEVNELREENERLQGRIYNLEHRLEEGNK